MKKYNKVFRFFQVSLFQLCFFLFCTMCTKPPALCNSIIRQLHRKHGFCELFVYSWPPPQQEPNMDSSIAPAIKSLKNEDNTFLKRLFKKQDVVFFLHLFTAGAFNGRQK